MEQDLMSVDDVFNGGAAAPVEDATVAVVEPPLAVDPAPAGEPATQPVAKTEPTQPEPDARELAGLKDAYRAEREKRQEYERKLAEYEAKLKAQPAPVQEEAPKEADFYDNPQGFIEAKLARIEQQAQVRSAMIQSEIMERDTVNFPQFPEMIEAFMQVARQNPQLADQMRASNNPAAFAYQTGKNLSEAKLYGGDVNKMLAAKVAEERAKWDADAQKAAENARLDALPKSTSQKRSDKGSTASADISSVSPFAKKY